jgi:hypothetical protein
VTGGFALASDSRGSLQTTRYAVSALGLLNESPKYSDALSTQLQDTYRAINNQPKPVSPKLLFMLSTIAKRVNDSQPPQDIVNNSLDATFSRNLSEVPLSQLFYATSVAADSGYNPPKQEIASRIYAVERPNGGFGKPVTTAKTYYSVKTLQLTDQTVSHPNRTLGFLKTAKQNGGYRLRKGDRFAPYPDVYATYLTVSALEALNSTPSDPAGTIQWLQQLHHARGFFTPYNERPSKPQIQHTYWALSSLSTLEEQRSAADVRAKHRTIPNPYAET